MASSELKTLRARVVAFYLPQFHVTPENELWWGRDFTDWVNVRAAKPLFEGHYQPRVPLNRNYYDLTSIDVLEWQVSLARDHGVSGFCHYHYWFDGRQLLQRPSELMLSLRELSFPFASRGSTPRGRDGGEAMREPDRCWFDKRIRPTMPRG